MVKRIAGKNQKQFKRYVEISLLGQILVIDAGEIEPPLSKIENQQRHSLRSAGLDRGNPE
jgi:hypothetical protein